MIETELISLYRKMKKQLASLMEDMTYANFFRALQSGKRVYTVKNTQIKRSIDEDWIEAIKEGIPHLDNIVNNPRKFMKRETEVVPVEKARIVDSESVKHLAAHTNLIRSVHGDEVRPDKILTAYNDESLELYENRFVMTLIIRVSQFIDRRYFLLGTGGNEFSSSIKIDGSFEQAGETTDYGLSMAVHQGADYFDGGISTQVYEDLFMIRKYVNSFRYSPFMKQLGNAAPVRPPIVSTNLLKKEPNYRACVKLWDFIESYDKVGYKIEVTDSAPMLDRDFAEDFDAVDLLLYVALKRKMGEFDGRRRNMQKCEKKVLKPTFEEFETSEAENIRSIDVPRGLKAALSGESKKDTEAAIKDVLLRALRKEQLKRELEEAERREKEQMLSQLVKAALARQRRQSAEEEHDREQTLKNALRAALAAQQSRERLAAVEQRRLERRVEKRLNRQVEQFREDEREQMRLEKREEKEREELLNVLLQDLLRIEEERDYIRTSPLALEGNRLPVPVAAPSLPAAPDLLQKLAEFDLALTPPLTLTDADWEEIRNGGKKARKKLGDDRLVSAIEYALKQEQQKRRREQERLQREQTDAHDSVQNKNNAQKGLDSDSDFTDDEILNVLQNAERLLDKRSDKFKMDVAKEAVRAEFAAKKQRKNATEGNTDNGMSDEDDEQTKGFWRRVFEILFLWWRK